MSIQFVTTTLGELPETDLVFEMIPQESKPDSWIMAREGRYVGTNQAFAEHVGKIIRRDVWVTMKSGLRAGATAGQPA